MFLALLPLCKDTRDARALGCEGTWTQGALVRIQGCNGYKMQGYKGCKGVQGHKECKGMGVHGERAQGVQKVQGHRGARGERAEGVWVARGCKECVPPGETFTT